MDNEIIKALSYWHIKKSAFGAVLCFIIGVFFSSCEKTDDFKEMLDNIPQINYSTFTDPPYKYKDSYMVGDTLKIVGFLYPEKGLKVRVGDVADARIVKQERVVYYDIGNGQDSLDRISVEITEDMGVGKNRPVSLSLKGNIVEGSPIAIYSLTGDGSFTKPLGLQTYTTATLHRQSTYLHCINGKGDVYYLGFSDKQLWHVAKDGTPTVLLTQEQLKNGETWTFNTIQPFLAGGVNPQGTKAWVSLQTQNDGYRFVEIDLQTKGVKTLNASTAIGSRYQGVIGEVNAVINGIFPDSKDNVYLKIGANTGTNDDTQAIATYNSNTGNISYLFKTVKAQSGEMPGNSLDLGYYQTVYGFRIHPEESLLYLVHEYVFSSSIGLVWTKGISLYNLKTGIKLANALKTSGGEEYIGPFTGTPTYMLNNVYGLLPIGGQRLAALYGKDLTSSGLPLWQIFSFDEQRTYRYATDKAELGSYFFAPTTGNSRIDELLNYDEQGHIYSTANGKSQLVRTVEL